MTYQVEIEPSGHRFSAEADETLLDAALRQGIGLPYGCRNGACGSCIATLLSGEVDYPDGQPEVECKTGQVVICQAHARSDLRLTVREVNADADITIKTLPCRAEHLERLSHDVMLVLLKLPEAERLQFLYAVIHVKFNWMS
jgi:CDP-4-dehydro-6-deoxyglucose reductase